MEEACGVEGPLIGCRFEVGAAAAVEEEDWRPDDGLFGERCAVVVVVADGLLSPVCLNVTDHAFAEHDLFGSY